MSEFLKNKIILVVIAVVTIVCVYIYFSKKSDSPITTLAPTLAPIPTTPMPTTQMPNATTLPPAQITATAFPTLAPTLSPIPTTPIPTTPIPATPIPNATTLPPVQTTAPTFPPTYPPKITNVIGSWFQMDFGSGKTLTNYGLYTDNPPYAPISWTLAGSNDTTTWYKIDVQTGKTWEQNATQFFNPSSTYAGSSYRYYRLIIQQNTSSSIMTPSTFYASDVNGPIGWTGKGTALISSDLSNGHEPNWTMNPQPGTADASWTNFFMISDNTYPGTNYKGSVSTPIFG